LLFFFSSRRRHTRFSRDWSSDVCSSDLVVSGMNLGVNLGDDVFYSGTVAAAREGALKGIPSIALSASLDADMSAACRLGAALVRSEERRVGKESRYRWRRWREKQERWQA